MQNMCATGTSCVILAVINLSNHSRKEGGAEGGESSHLNQIKNGKISREL